MALVAVVMVGAGCSSAGVDASTEEVESAKVSTSASVVEDRFRSTGPAMPGGPGAAASATSAPEAGSTASMTTGMTSSGPQSVALTSTLATTPSAAGPSPTVTYLPPTNLTGSHSGPMTTVTTNGAVWILPAQPTVTLAPELKVTFTIAPGVDVTGIDIEGAKAAYLGFARISDEAFASAVGDWSDAFAEFAVKDIVDAEISSLAQTRASGMLIAGHPIIAIQIMSAAPGKVNLEGCVDTTGLDLVSADHTVMRGGDGPGNYWRHKMNAIIAQVDGRWLLEDISNDMDQSC